MSIFKLKNHTRKIAATLLLIASAIFSTYTIAQAQQQPGTPDPSFDGDGKVFTAFSSTYTIGTDVVIQTDGKIVVGGRANGNDFNTPFEFALARYNPNGSLDTTFDVDGKVTTNLDTNFASLLALALQPDGKIVAVGRKQITDPVSGNVPVVVRYNSNGSLDTTFNGTGKLQLNFNNLEQESAKAVVIQADGKILIGGDTMNLSDPYPSYFAVVRLNPNGSLDTTFNNSGKLIIDLGTNERFGDIALQPDGKIVVGGRVRLSGDTADASILLRYNSNGAIDSGFGGNGLVASSFFGIGGNDATTIELQTDGKIVVASSGVDSSVGRFFVVTRYSTTGSLDSTFGNFGYASIDFQSGSYIYVTDLALQRNGKIVVAGFIQSSSGNSYYFALARFNANGSPDTDFRNQGQFTDNGFDNSGNDVRAQGVAIQADGKIVAAGQSLISGTSSGFAVARYFGDAVAAQRARFDFDGDGKADVSVFRPSNGTWYLNQSAAGFTGAAFGTSTDKIVPADYDGDGKTDIAVYRGGTWYLQRSQLGFTGIAFGASDDIPVPADYDGDGKADIAVFRPSTGIWYLQRSQLGFIGIAFGQTGDKPVAADYDGDGRADVAVNRNGTWYIQRSTLGFTGIAFGDSNDKLVPADYDGDGKADVAVFRPSNGTWYLQRSGQGFIGIPFGLSTDVPVAADYDGDGKADVAVFRNGTWYIQQSSQGFTGVSFGAASDKPIPAAFIP